MLCSVIEGPSFEEAKNQIEMAIGHADLFEFRLDLWNSLERVAELKSLTKGFVIFTLRSSLQGGGWRGVEKERYCLLQHLAHLMPDYIDLEYDIDPEFAHQLMADF